MIRDMRKVAGLTIHRIRTQSRGMDYETVGWALLKDGELLRTGEYQPLHKWAKENHKDVPDEISEGTWFDGYSAEFEALLEAKRAREEGPSVFRCRGLFYELAEDIAGADVQTQAKRVAKENRQDVYFIMNGTLHRVSPNGEIVHTRFKPSKKRKLNA